jgi:hypothetical protein
MVMIVGFRICASQGWRSIAFLTVRCIRLESALLLHGILWLIISIQYFGVTITVNIEISFPSTHRPKMSDSSVAETRIQKYRQPYYSRQHYHSSRKCTREDVGENRFSKSHCVLQEATEWGSPSDETGKTEALCLCHRKCGMNKDPSLLKGRELWA